MWSLFKGAWEHYVDPYVQALIDEPAVEMEVVQASPDIDDLIHELPMDDSPLIFDPELQQDAAIELQDMSYKETVCRSPQIYSKLI